MNRLVGGVAAMGALGAVMATSAQDAEAAFLLRLTDGVTSTQVLVQDDTSAGVVTAVGTTTSADSFAGLGAIQFSAAIGGTVWTVNVTTGFSKPVIGSNVQKLHLNSVNISSAGAGTIRVELTDTGFTSTLAAPLFSVGIGGFTGGSVQLNHAAIDPNNAHFASTVDITGGGLGPFTGAFSASASKQVNVGAGSPFSMSLAATITHYAPGQVSSFDTDISVPEPGSLGLFGLGLLGLGFLWRRRAGQDLAA